MKATFNKVKKTVAVENELTDLIKTVKSVHDVLKKKEIFWYELSNIQNSLALIKDGISNEKSMEANELIWESLTIRWNYYSTDLIEWEDLEKIRNISFKIIELYENE